MKNKSFKIEISPFFYITLALVYVLKVYELFLLAFLFTLLHELSHIFIAKLYNLKIKKICISPIGLIAIIDGLDNIALYKRLIVVSIGVLFNICIYIILSYIPNTNYTVQLIKNINLSIALFNIIPIFPLDGGKFFIYLVGSFIGDLKACKIIKNFSLYFCICIAILGFLQLFISPFNISLLCLCIYIIKINKNLYILELYKILTYEDKNISKLKIKQISVPINYLNKDIILNFSTSYYTIINVYKDGNIIYKIYENNFIKYVKENGLLGHIYDIMELK